VVQFEELAAAFGYSLGLGTLPVKRIQTRGDRREAQRSGRNARSYEVPEDIAVTPKMYQRLAARIEGKPVERILSYLMLRSLRQARYSEVNEGHFALAAPSYTHFTSPIRRYPDLIVHRITKALLRDGVKGEGVVAHGRHSSPWTHVNEGGASGSVGTHPMRKSGRPRNGADVDPPVPEEELAQIAEETSLTERRAAEAERELVEWKKVRFMQDRVGEEFAALVLNPTKYGMFVELTDMFVEGLVPIDSLRDDRYTWRENTHEIMGERWGRRFRAGERVNVILDRILAQERRLQFSLVEEGIPLTGKTAAKSVPGAKSSARKNKRKDARTGAAPKGRKHSSRKGKRR
jgi:ribonuclease R